MWFVNQLKENMKKNDQLVYWYNGKFSTLEDDKVVFLNIQGYLNKLNTRINKKIRNRNLCAYFSGVFCLAMLSLLATLLLTNVIDWGTMGLYYFTLVIAGMVLVWLLLYYALGFIFFPKEKIDMHFKDLKRQDALIRYASSNYSSYINTYTKYAGTNCLVSLDKNGKNVTPLTFKLIKPNNNIVNAIFNYRISLNVPYFYLSLRKDKFIFLPGICIYMNNRKAICMLNDDLSVSMKDNNYTLAYHDEILLRFSNLGDFNVNFFNFKY